MRIESEQRHHIIQKEYRQIYEKEQVDPESQAVVVLSGPPAVKNGPENYRELNASKVEFGIQVLRRMAALKLQKPVAEVQNQDLVELNIPLLLNGEIEEIPFMREAALATGFPSELIDSVPAGKTGKADTRHNFWELERIYPELKRVTIVTGKEAVPRAVRTGLHELKNQETKLHFIGWSESPDQKLPSSTIKTELNKIGSYAEKGDLSVTLTEEEQARLVPESELAPLRLHKPKEKPLPPDTEIQEFVHDRIYGERVTFNPENPLASVDQRLVDIGNEVAEISGTWNPVEIYTPSEKSVEVQKKKFLEAYDAGEKYLPEFEYDVAKEMGNLDEKHDRLVELLCQVLQFRKKKTFEGDERVWPLTPREELARIAIAHRINDALFTIQIVRGIRNKNDEVTRRAVLRKYGKLNETVLGMAKKRYVEMTTPGPEPKRKPALLTPEQQKLLEDTQMTAEDLKEAIEWILNDYGFLRAEDDDDITHGFRVEMDGSTKFDVRDKSVIPMTVYIPRKSEPTAKDIIRLQWHEIEAHARQGMNSMAMLGFGAKNRFDGEKAYEGLAMRGEEEMNEELFGISPEDSPPWSPPFDILIMEQALKGANFHELFEMSLKQRLRTDFKVPEGQDLDAAIEKAKEKDPEKTAKAIKKAKEKTWLVVHKNMRGLTDPENKSGYALTKDTAYAGGYHKDKELRDAGYGWMNETGIIPEGGFKLMAKLGINEQNLRYPLKRAAVKYCMEILLPKLEARAKATSK